MHKNALFWYKGFVVATTLESQITSYKGNDQKVFYYFFS